MEDVFYTGFDCVIKSINFSNKDRARIFLQDIDFRSKNKNDSTIEDNFTLNSVKALKFATATSLPFNVNVPINDLLNKSNDYLCEIVWKKPIDEWEGFLVGKKVYLVLATYGKRKPEKNFYGEVIDYDEFNKEQKLYSSFNWSNVTFCGGSIYHGAHGTGKKR